MTRPHLTLNHVLMHMETYAARRNNRDNRPDWLSELIDNVADLFEPLTGVGRVGYECQLADDGWVVGLYLGSTETVGGSHDGLVKFANFEFDIQKLTAFFSEVDELWLGAFPEPVDAHEADARSYITLAGLVHGNRVRVQIFSVPPRDVGPGMRVYPNGHCEPV